MLHLVFWAAVYWAIAATTSRLARTWRSRRWFQVAFLPGTLLAVGIQAPVAWLTVGRRFRVAWLEPGRPAFRLSTKHVPVLAGSLFVFLSHLALYIAFLLVASRLDAVWELRCELLTLPELEPHQALEGYFELDPEGYLDGLAVVLRSMASHPGAWALLLWVAAPALASLEARPAHWLWASVLLTAVGLVGYCADWLGLGFPFLSRGWWAGWLYFPRWWGLFTLWISVTAVCLTLLVVARGVSNMALSLLPPKAPPAPPTGQTAEGARRPARARRRPLPVR